MSTTNQLTIGPPGAIGSGQHLTINAGGTIAWANSGVNLNTALGNVNTGSLKSIWLHDNEYVNPNVKKYQVYESTEDLLALSTCWQRIRSDKTYIGQRPESITDEVLFNFVTFEDKKKAEKIRDYYSKKFTLWALNGVKLTSFREDLKKFIHSDGKIFKEDMKALVYRLPEFYDYDTEFDEMISNHSLTSNQTERSVTATKNLTFVKKLVKTRKKGINIVTNEFWFTDDYNNLNCIPVNKDNPLLTLMEKYTRLPFSVKANSVKKVRDNREFFVLEKYSFL
mgnify:CR=1 FL=1